MTLPPPLDPTADPEFLDESEFAQRLQFEALRTGRSGVSFVLVLLESPQLLGPRAARGLTERVATAFCATVRDTDVRGWHRMGTALGAIFTEIEPGEEDRMGKTFAGQIESRLAGVLTAAECRLARVSFRVHQAPAMPVRKRAGVEKGFQVEVLQAPKRVQRGS